MIKVVVFDVLGVLIGQNGLLTQDRFKHILSKLKEKQISICVLSNSSKHLAVSHKELGDFINTHTDQDFFLVEDNMFKPEPEAYEKVLQHYNVTAKECLLIDDGSDNIEAAKRMGFETYLYRDAEGCLGALNSIVDIQ